MIIAYGYKRADRDFAKHNPEKVFIDAPGTKREARHDMLHGLGIREGDTVLVFSERDFGGGVEINKVREFIAAAGGTVKVLENASLPKKSKRRGFHDDDRTLAETLWHTVGVSVEYINTRMKHGPYARSQFNDAFGRRY